MFLKIIMCYFTVLNVATWVMIFDVHVHVMLLTKALCRIIAYMCPFFCLSGNFSVSAAYRYRRYSYYSYYSSDYSYTGSTTSSIPVGAVGGIVAAGVLLVFLVFFTIICCQIHTRANRAIHPSSVNGTSRYTLIGETGINFNHHIILVTVILIVTKLDFYNFYN